jgi:hypothetical protein
VDCESLLCDAGVCAAGEGGLTGMYHYSNLSQPAARVSTDAVVDFDWGALGPMENSLDFTVRWAGTITPKYTEEYTFYLNASNLSALTIDGTLVTFHSSSGVTESSGTISLEAGRAYPIQLDFDSNGDPGVVQLLWESASQQKEVVRRTQLRPLDGGLLGQYYASTVISSSVLRLTRVDYMIAFDWGDWSPAPNLSSNYFSVRWTGSVIPRYSETYTIRTETDDQVRVWMNGSLIIDNWTDGTAPKSGTISLEANVPAPITIEFKEWNETARLKLFWTSPSQADELIPGSNLLPPEAMDGVFMPEDDVIVMEAEHFNLNEPRNNNYFEFVTETTAADGHVMAAYPNTGRDNATDYRELSPRLDYKVYIEESMTPYYIWVRGYGTPLYNDTCHVGTDDGWNFFGENLLFDGTNGWRNLGDDNSPAQVVFETPGVKTVSLWMARDGFRADRILLTADSTYVPADEGPDESSRVAYCESDAECDDGSECTDDTCRMGICESLDNQNCCDEETAVDLGLPGWEYATTVADDACVMVRDGYPAWWDVRELRLQPSEGSVYPIPFTWSNQCQSVQGSSELTIDWQESVLSPTDEGCPTLINLQGSGTGTVTLRYYGGQVV